MNVHPVGVERAVVPARRNAELNDEPQRDRGDVPTSGAYGSNAMNTTLNT